MLSTYNWNEIRQSKNAVENKLIYTILPPSPKRRPVNFVSSQMIQNLTRFVEETINNYNTKYI